MRQCVILGILLVAGLAISTSPAGAQTPDVIRQAPDVDTVPPYVSTFPSSEATLADDDFVLAMPQEPGPLTLDRHTGLSAFDDETSGGGGKKSYWPVLYSLIIPGAGEISLGYTWRGIALIGLEAVAWTGYAINRSDGLDSREQFEAFADAHWDHDRWIQDHLATEAMIAGGADPNDIDFAALDAFGRSDQWAQWPGYHSYADRENDKQNYYENIGKYDWFISGWSDWDKNAADPMNTALRTEYRGMRKQSNDELQNADRFLYLSLGVRVFSLIETLILVNKQPSEDKAESSPDKSYHLTARSTGFHSGEVAFEVRFK